MNCSQECLLYSQFRRNVLLSGQFIYQEQSQLFDDVLSTDNQGTPSNFLSLTYTHSHTYVHQVLPSWCGCCDHWHQLLTHTHTHTQHRPSIHILLLVGRLIRSVCSTQVSRNVVHRRSSFTILIMCRLLKDLLRNLLHTHTCPTKQPPHAHSVLLT